MILVGTTGFQYREWARIFYPANLDPKYWLRYYGGKFGCCEIAFTHFRLPEPLEIGQLAAESRGTLQFVFRVPARLCGEAPHDAGLAQKFAAALWPLKDLGQLQGVVAQFPPAFEFIRDNYERLCLLRDSLEGIPLVAEFGCPSWNTPRAARHLSSARIALACIDGGAGKPFFCATAGLGYVRFQGRNRSRWLKGDGSAQHDYLYSRAAIAAAVPEIRRMEQDCDQVLVFMNNPWRGHAVVNAAMLLQELSIVNADHQPQ